MFKKLLLLGFVVIASFVLIGAESASGTLPQINFFTLGLSVVASILVAVITALITTRHFEIKNNKDDTQKAIELSELFAQKIVGWTNYITVVYTAIKIKEINYLLQQAIDKGEILHFDNNEYGTFYKISNDELLEKVKELDIEVFVKARTRLVLVGLCPDFEVQVDKGYLVQEFVSIQAILSNTLEYFSMYFNSEIAKEDAVYQSLHQAFMASVILLYPSICAVNKKSSDKYFTNIVDLFNKWSSKKYRIESELRQLESQHIKAASGYKKK